MTKSKQREPVRPEYEETLYAKRNGKYYPVTDPWACTGLRDGHWYVWVRGTGTTLRKMLFPERGNALAAVAEFGEGIAEVLRDARRIDVPKDGVKMSRKEQRAWAAYRKAMGMKPGEPVTMYGPSEHELVEAGRDALANRLFD